MMPHSANTLPVLAVGLLIGVAALVLVANELGKRAGLPLPGRVALGGGLGLGVMAVGIKVLIIATLSQSDGASLARAGTAARARLSALVPDSWVEDATTVAPVSTAASPFRTWRALPETARDPKNNPSSPAKIALGRALFFDTNLSSDRSVSCASCHGLSAGGDDDARVSTGVGGLTGDRNAPTVLNAAFLSRLFWDGRAASLEAQAMGPLVNPVEMAMPDHAAVMARVAENPAYQDGFAKVFGGKSPITIGNIARAIASFERQLITPDSAYDRFVRGDSAALSPQALRGMALFDAVGCRSCHVDPVFSSAGTIKPLGIYRRFPVYPDNPFIARYGLLKDGKPGLWRVPSLRNVARTAPYFHNGSVTQLEEAIRIMAVSQLGRQLSDLRTDDMLIQTAPVAGDTPGLNLSLARDRALSEAEIADIAAFLRSLSAELPPDVIGKEVSNSYEFSISSSQSSIARVSASSTSASP